MTLKELVEKKNELIARGKKLVSDAEMQTRSLSDEEKAEFDGIDKEINELKEQIEKEKNNIERGVTKTMENKELEVRAMQEKAFINFIQGQEIETRADAPFDYTDNSAVVPKSVLNRIIDKLFKISPIIEMATTYRVKGDLVVPYYTTDSNNDPTDVTAGYATEFSAPDATSGKISGVTLKGFVVMAFSLISKSLLNNAIPNVLDFIIDKTAYAVKKFVEGQIINGTQNKIEGLSGATNTKTTATAGVVTADEIIALQDKVADDYQANAIWLMSPATRTTIRTLKGGDGKYLLQPDFTARWGYRMLGHEVYTSENVNDLASAKRFMFYGDFANALVGKISEEMNVQVLREAYALKHAVGVLAETECDYKVVNQQAVAVMVSATSL